MADSFHAFWDKVNGKMYRKGRPTQYNMADYAKELTSNPINGVDGGYNLRLLSQEDMGRYGHEDVAAHYLSMHGDKNPLRLGPPMTDLEFKKFMGQVVETTAPMTLWHGTNKKFNNFEYKDSKRFVLWDAIDVKTKGFFFSESPKIAAKYGKHVMRCLVSVNNFLLDPRKDKHLAVDPLPEKTVQALGVILSSLIKDHPEYGKHIEPNLGFVGVRDDDPEWVYHYVHKQGLSWEALDEPGVVAAMVKLGYDGTFVSEENDKERSIFVPSANQIQFQGYEDLAEEEDDY